MYSRIATALLIVALAACSGSDNDGSRFNEVPSPPPNQAPEILAIADQIIDSGTSTDALVISISDDTTAPGELLLSVSADNPDLLNEGSFSFGGMDGERTLTVTPIAEATGMANISVVVADADGIESQTSFLLTVEQATVSLSGFVRDVFAADANSEPVAVDRLVFEQDAANDDFADLVQ